MTVVLNLRRYGCAAPACDADGVALSQLSVRYHVLLCRSLDAELLADKQESVCQRLPLYEIFGVEIDTELGIVLLSFGQYEIRILIEYCVLTIKFADDIYLVLGGCTGRYDHLQKNGIRLGLKLRLLVLKLQLLRLAAEEGTKEQAKCTKGQCTMYNFVDCFHNSQFSIINSSGFVSAPD